MQVSDVPARFADPHIVAAWNEVGHRWGKVQSQMALPLLITPQGCRGFVVGRADPYTRQEMRLARTLGQLLSGLDRQITMVARWSRQAAPDAWDIAEAIPLTTRELAVLSLLADGLTAGAIGRRLLINQRTVQKHLERCYTKLGARDRLAAVMRAQRLGVLPAAEDQRPKPCRRPHVGALIPRAKYVNDAMDAAAADHFTADRRMRPAEPHLIRKGTRHDSDRQGRCP